MAFRARLPLRLATLEDRTVPTTFTVASIADGGAADTLRAAITLANANPGPDSIVFAVGTGQKTITLISPLPAITDAVTIDGTTQPGFNGVPQIFVDGANAGAAANGLELRDHTGSTVKSLALGNFGGAAILTNTVAKTAGSHTITGSYLGLDSNGNVKANAVGVVLRGLGTTVGGTGSAGNVISGNKQAGIRAESGGTHLVINNRIGTNVAGNKAIANPVGIDVGDASVTIGGSKAGEGNQVSGNTTAGIQLAPLARTTIRGNRVGPDNVDKAGIGNGYGVLTVGQPTAATPNTIGGTGAADGNFIAFNTLSGVAVTRGFAGVSILGNEFAGNGKLGIDLSDFTTPDDVVTVPDAQGDGAGGNGLQGPPTLAKATNDGATTTVTFDLFGQANTSYRVELFFSNTANASGSGEGELFLGSVNVQLNAVGTATASVATLNTGTLANGKPISATATNLANGNTSEFAKNVLLATAPPPTAVTGRVFIDTNLNGAIDGNEAGQAGAVVFIDANGDGVRNPAEVFDTTDATGDFNIGVSPGQFTLGVEPLAGFFAVTPPAPVVVTVQAGQVTTQNLGVRQPEGTFTGVVFYDENGNGIRDTADNGYFGVTVFADANNNKTPDAGEIQATTDAAGAFTLRVFVAGTYEVRAVPPAGFKVTSPDLGGKGASGGAVFANQNVGIRADTNGLLRGTTFADLNNNGTQDGGEPVQTGLVTFIDVNDNGIPDTGEQRDITDALGNYRLVVAPGTYRVRVTPPTGFKAPTPAPVVVTAGQAVTLNFANQPVTTGAGGSVTGTVFVDTNGNGVQDGGEAGQPGVSVFLDANKNGSFDAGIDPAATSGTTGVFALTHGVNGTFNVFQTPPANFLASTPNPVAVTLSGGNAVTATFGNRPVGNIRLFAVAADATGGPHVRVFNADGSFRFGFFAYDVSFTGGVRVAVADVNGDGIDDIITAAGRGGGPHVRIFSGAGGADIGGFFAYAPTFAGGVFVAAGDVNGDGTPDIITGAGAGGGPHVRVFDGNDLAGGTELRGFFAYPATFAGGVYVAAGLIDGDNRADVVTGPGAGLEPRVRIFGGAGSGDATIGEFLAYAPTFTGGVTVAAGDTEGDNRAEIITGAATAGGPHVRVFNLAGAELRGFFAYPATFGGGVRVGVGDINNDGRDDILVGTGPGNSPSSLVRGFGANNLQAFETDPFPGFRGGVFVG